MTKQAFSKVRHKIPLDAFKELFEMTGQSIIKADAFSRYNGYCVFGVDDTELQLPKSEEISHNFLQIHGSFSQHTKVSVLCDVITSFTVLACTDTTGTGGRVLAMGHLRYFGSNLQAKDLIVFDNGYPAKALIKHLYNNGFKYLMRLQKCLNAEIDNSINSDF